MIKRNKNTVHHLPLETMIEVVATCGDKVIKKPMTFGEWMRMKSKPGWKYSAYQEGFCTIKEKRE